MIRLNLGCGNYPKRGWINCDKLGGYQRWEETPLASQIMVLDLRAYPYPFPDCSVELITLSHCLNQIEIHHIGPIIGELYRILKPGGIARITDDDVESPASPIFKQAHVHALWHTGPKIICDLMERAGFRRHVVTKDTSFSEDSSIMSSNHPELPDNGVFFVEGVKPIRAVDWADKAARLQEELGQALQYFLYSSLWSPKARCLPSRWRWLSTKPLVKVMEAFESVNVPGCRWPRRHLGFRVSGDVFAEILALAYHLWSEILEQGKLGPMNQTTMAVAQTYRQWLLAGGHASKYRVVDALRSMLLAKEGGDFFLRGIVHGSIASLDDTPGFSDLDLAFVVKASVLRDPRKLVELRRLAVHILTITYAFDPFMHHGPYYLSEIDLAWYPEAVLPSVLFGYGVDLQDRAQELAIWTRASDDITDRMLDRFERFFESWPSNPFLLKDSYDLEWVLANAMILPALYLQRRTGEFRYKRDTFHLAERDFSPEEWEPIRAATALRATLGPRPKPSGLLVWLALQFGSPGFLQWFACRHPMSVRRAREATKKLGPDYPQRVLRLLRMMRSKLLEVLSTR